MLKYYDPETWPDMDRKWMHYLPRNNSWYWFVATNNIGAKVYRDISKRVKIYKSLKVRFKVNVRWS